MELLKQEAMTGETPEKLANSPAARVPLPDLVITCNNICNTLLKWYENLAKELDIPCIIIDVPSTTQCLYRDVARNTSQLSLKSCRKFLKRFAEENLTMTNSLRFKQVQRSVEQWNRVDFIRSVRAFTS